MAMLTGEEMQVLIMASQKKERIRLLEWNI